MCIRVPFQASHIHLTRTHSHTHTHARRFHLPRASGSEDLNFEDLKSFPAFSSHSWSLSINIAAAARPSPPPLCPPSGTRRRAQAGHGRELEYEASSKSLKASKRVKSGCAATRLSPKRFILAAGVIVAPVKGSRTFLLSTRSDFAAFAESRARMRGTTYHALILMYVYQCGVYGHHGHSVLLSHCESAIKDDVTVFRGPTCVW